MAAAPPVRFSAISLNHAHIYGQTNLLLRAGAELVWFYAARAYLAARYADSSPQANQAGEVRAILEDPSIQLSSGPESHASGARWGRRFCSTARTL